MSTFPTEPIRRSFAPDKQGAKRHYGSHPYFTKRAWNVVQEYIKHFSKPGQVVLDPFGGSGVTAVESLVLRRKARYVDISEWACFLARETAIAPVNLSELSNAFMQVERRCRRQIEKLWNRPDEELANTPVAHWYPREVRLPENSDVRFVEELFTPKMLHGLARLRAGIQEIEDAETRALLLLAFSSTLVRINLTFLSASNRQESRGGSAVFSLYRYKVAKRPVELPLWGQFAHRVEKLIQAKQETNHLIGDYYREGKTASFAHGSATTLSAMIEPESVDYIYTDPPYGAHISYLDLSTMWAAWLGLDITDTDRREEVIEGGQLHKSRDEYQHLLSAAIGEMARTLKKGAWLSLVFAHRDTAYWDAIVQACQEAGLGYVNTVVQPVGVVWSMHKKKNPLRVLSGELVLNFRRASRVKPLKKTMRQLDAEDLAVGCCAKEIVRNDGATTEDLHHAVVPALLEAGLLSDFGRTHGDMTPLIGRVFAFDRRAGRWHLRPTVRCEHDGVSEQELSDYFIRRFLAENHAEGSVPAEELVEYLSHLRLTWQLLPIAAIKKRYRALWVGERSRQGANTTQHQLFRG